MLSPGSTTSTDFKELPNRNHRQKLGHIKRWNWSTMINFWKFILTFRKSSYTPQSEPTVEVDTEKPELSCSTPTTSTIEEGKVLGELQRYFIVDCSSIAYVDTMGVEALQEVRIFEGVDLHKEPLQNQSSVLDKRPTKYASKTGFLGLLRWYEMWRQSLLC